MRILFQGDSITDGGRDFRNYFNLGTSYPLHAAEMIRNAFPEIEFEFINQGIGGNRTDQLFDRLYADAIALEPDIVSVLIGVNDVWARYSKSKSIQTSVEQIEANFRAILKSLRKRTNAKILVLTPYLLDSEVNEPWRAELDEIQPILRRIADEYADAFVPLHEHFAEALKTQPQPQFYSPDGVHPNPNGAKFIAEHYFNAIAPLIRSCVK